MRFHGHTKTLVHSIYGRSVVGRLVPMDGIGVTGVLSGKSSPQV